MNGIALTLKGYGEKYHLCSWVQDGHFRCIYSDEDGYSETEMLDIAEKVIAS